MRWIDRVYGEVTIDDPKVVGLIESPTYQRLYRIKQAGPSAFSFPLKAVTRGEHSLGVFVLLRKLGANLQEQVAGLLHDLSHTAFSHAVDFVISSEEQDYHETLKPQFLNRADIKQALSAFGYVPEEFYDDSIYSLLERPLPWLCADRLDYFFRDGLACGAVGRAAADRMLEDLRVVEETIAFQSVGTAREARDLYAVMNRDWWASPTEAYIYNEFADALREGLSTGVLQKEDLLEDDAHVTARLRNSGNALILAKLDRITQFQPEWMVGFTPRVVPKNRWIDPPVVAGESIQRLSDLEEQVEAR